MCQRRGYAITLDEGGSKLTRVVHPRVVESLIRRAFETGGLRRSLVFAAGNMSLHPKATALSERMILVEFVPSPSGIKSIDVTLCHGANRERTVSIGAGDVDRVDALLDEAIWAGAEVASSFGERLSKGSQGPARK